MGIRVAGFDAVDTTRMAPQPSLEERLLRLVGAPLTPSIEREIRAIAAAMAREQSRELIVRVDYARGAISIEEPTRPAPEPARSDSSDAETLQDALRDLGYMQRRAWRRRICVDIDAAARKTPITAAELRARLFSRPLPRRRLRDGRLGPQAYAPEDPLPLP